MNGYSLTELAIVLMLIGIVMAFGVPAATRGRDAMAVAGARDEVTSAFAAARSAAILHGGAVLVLETVPGRVRLEAPDGRAIGDAREITASHGVTLECDRGAVVMLRFDALGVGRITNGVIRLRRGGARATLTVSAYGRVRQ